MDSAAAYLLVLMLGFAAAVALRAWPRRQPGAFVRDAFYDLVLVRALRRQKRLPVFLDNYMLDSGEQRCPPGFPLFLALLPGRTAERRPGLVNPALDAGLGAGLGVLLWVHGAGVAQVLWAVLAWALTPALVRTCAGLNRRIFGNALFTICMLLMLHELLERDVLRAAALAAAGAALLLSHRRSTQNFVFTALGLAVWRQSWTPAALLGMVFAAALAVSAGFYGKVLIGNIEGLVFRRRNVRRLGAHMVYGSPLYARDPEVARLAADAAKSFTPGLRGLVENAWRGLGRNFLLPVFAFVVATNYDWWTEFERLLAAWVALTYLWSALTAFVPPLRFLGAGVRYEKMAAFPMIYLTVSGMGWGAPWWLLPVFLACLALNAWQVRRIYRELASDTPEDRDLDAVLEALRRSSDDGVLTLPGTISERIVFETGKKVFWGGHGAFRRLEEFYPVLRRNVQDYFLRYNLTFLILDVEYAQARFLDLAPWFDPVISTGRYTLYRYHPPPAAGTAEWQSASGGLREP